ncbi:MAG: polysaccharide biosynthesis/export family protein [Verrucomicrobia bacterium]|nr:polysaccharide biosynthesis/export family protein [Verrucomicrobiota bacterium]MDA1087366.1 polysaccharide biosynthesis/export family protein [Verrucomicrobiota bacterium]
MKCRQSIILRTVTVACLGMRLAGCTSTTSWDRATAEYQPNLDGLRLPGGSPVTPLEMLDAGRLTPRAPAGNAERPPNSTRPKDVRKKDATATVVAADAEIAPVARTLSKGDALSISLHALELVTLEEVIDARGNITLPYVGSVRLDGLTPPDAEERVWQIYVAEKKIFQKELVVTIIPSARTFFIKGEVNRPSPYSLRPGLTLTKAIATASGPTQWANDKKIKIRKESGATTTHSLPKIEAGKDRDPVIDPGDIIEVPRRWY